MSEKDGTPTTSTGSDDKSETAQPSSNTEKKPPAVPNRGRTFDATGTEKRG